MAEQWVSFLKIKDQMSMKDVLDHYGLRLRSRRGGDELAGLCPFHGPGTSRDPFRASLSTNNWHWFQCDRGGNILDFVAQHEDIGIRVAALTIQEWFGTGAKSVTAPAREETTNEVGDFFMGLTLWSHRLKGGPLCIGTAADI